MKQMLLALALSLVLLAGCVQQTGLDKIIPNGTDSQNSSLGTITPVQPIVNSQEAPKKFANIGELKQYLADNTMNGANSGIRTYAPMPALDTGINMIAGAVQGEKASAGSTADYSQTNVQVAGVDEADFVKTDGNYIYLISGSKLVIVDARDSKNAHVIFEKEIFSQNSQDYSSPQAQEMFVNNGTLAIFASVPKQEIYFQQYDIVPQQNYRDYTGLFVFDINDPSNPKLVSNLTVLGNYYQSRMVGNTVYFVSQEYAGGEVYPPILYDGAKAYSPDIYYFDNPQDQYVFNTITSYDLSSKKMVDSKSYLMGYSSTLMMSEDNMYIAYQKNYGWCRWCYGGVQYGKERFDGVILPMLPSELSDKIKGIESSSLDEAGQWEQISDALKEYFAPALDSGIFEGSITKQRKELLQNIEDALAEYDAKKQIDQTSTNIYKFSVNNGEINFVAQGAVHGSLLNQFSMDEYNGNLRVATTVNVWAQKQVEYNNVYVLDSGMKTIGSLEQIAKDEQIYSARFMQDRLYLVTYKQVDPFFAIDLSDAKNPKVLGELKLPGYSSYLHPYSKDVIIGVGKQTEQNEWGGTSTGGIKVALFNVSDPANPKVIDSMEFGDSGSDSAVLYDHKAFLLDEGRDLMVLPLKVVKRDSGVFSDKVSTWDGAVALEITSDGLDQYGAIKHGSQENFWGGWWSQGTVRRSLYIGDALYTFSDSKILVNEISNGTPQIGEIDLSPQKDSGLIPASIALPEINMPVIK
ncbi:MAG: beta-propeller domain-containing protein [Candidatus Micrarchaeota archaeon]